MCAEEQRWEQTPGHCPRWLWPLLSKHHQVPSKDDRFRDKLRDIQVQVQFMKSLEKRLNIIMMNILTKVDAGIQPAMVLHQILPSTCLRFCLSTFLLASMETFIDVEISKKDCFLKSWHLMKGYFRLQEWMGFRELSAGLKRRLVTFYIDSWRCSGDLYNEKVIARCISFKEGSSISRALFKVIRWPQGN